MLPDKPQHAHTHGAQIFTDTLIEDWRAHPGDCTAKSVLSVPKGKLHRNILELKENLSTCVSARPFELPQTKHSCILHKQGGKYEIMLCMPPCGDSSPAASSNSLACYVSTECN